MQRGGNMSLACRRAGMICMMMMLNFFCICILMGLSWTFGRGLSHSQKTKVPSERFWSQLTLSDSFWNREQQRLDIIYNPNLSSVLSGSSDTGLPDWLNDTGSTNPCEPDHRVALQVLDYNTLPRPFQDFLLHMRCRTYPMLINQPHVCDDKPFLLLAVKSLVPHFDRRQAIRDSWGRAGVVASRSVVTVFLLGNAESVDHFPDLLWLLYHEVEHHRDILLWNYRDTFYNLTLKEVLFQEWLSQHCPQVHFILKGDDDVFVNTPRIIDFLEDLPEVKARNLFIGDVISNASPHRNPKLKYFIPESVFVGSYPPYAGGGGYLYSGDLALRLHNISQQVALYPIDDVYTGMCLKKLGLTPEKHSGFKTFDIEQKYKNNLCIYRNLMLVHSRTPQDMLMIWPWIVHPEWDCQ